MLPLLNNSLLEIRFYLSADLLKEGNIPSVSYIFNSILCSIIDSKDNQGKWYSIQTIWYSIQTIYIDWEKYYDIEKRNSIKFLRRRILRLFKISMNIWFLYYKRRLRVFRLWFSCYAR